MVVLAIAGLLLAWIAITKHRVGDVFAETDFYGAYADGARAIAAGHLDPARYRVVGPVYDATLALTNVFTRDLFRAGEVIAVLSAVATLGLWYAIAARLASPAVGLGTVVFLAANAFFFRYGYSVTTDELALALQAGAIFCLVGGRARWAALAAGLCAGLAFLTRYSAIVLVPAAVAHYLWLGRAPAGGRRWRELLSFAAGFLGLALPWTLFSLASGHRPGGELYHNIAYEVFARARGLTWDQYEKTLEPQFHSLADVVRRDPAAVVKQCGRNVIDHLRLDGSMLLGWPVALTALLGAAIAILDGSWRRLRTVALFAALSFVSLIPVLHSPRYALATAPWYMLLAGVAAGSPRLALYLPRPRVALKWILALVPLVLAARVAAIENRYWLSQLPYEVLPASAALRAAGPDRGSIMARKPHIAYHAGLDYVPMPLVTTLRELGDYCHAHQVDFLYFSWLEARARPEFCWLVDTTATAPGLTRVAFVERHPAAVYRIGPEFGADPEWFADRTLATVHMARGQALVYKDQVWEANLTLGAWAIRSGQPAEALDYLARVRRRRPDLARGYTLTGEAQLALGRPDSAAAAFKIALRLDPNESRARVGLAAADSLTSRERRLPER